MKVLIADDHAIVRRGLKDILADEYQPLIIGEARNALEVLTLIRQEDWDIVILDISMPGKNGLEIIEDMKQLRPKLPILILTTHAEELYAVRALKLGAMGYLTKESATELLIEAIRKVLSGRKYISPALTDLLVGSITGSTEKLPHENLSNRECQILCLLAEGKTVGQIAEELFLSVTTVSTYRTRILEKMGMKTTAELIHYAINNHLIK